MRLGVHDKHDKAIYPSLDNIPTVTVKKSATKFVTDFFTDPILEQIEIRIPKMILDYLFRQVSRINEYFFLFYPTDYLRNQCNLRIMKLELPELLIICELSKIIVPALSEQSGNELYNIQNESENAQSQMDNENEKSPK